jgi:hypothetical protein
VKDMWDLWYFGNIVTGVRPFRCLVGHEDDPREHKHKVNLSRAKGVIEELESLGREHRSIETVEDILEMEDDFQSVTSSFTECTKTLCLICTRNDLLVHIRRNAIPSTRE